MATDTVENPAKEALTNDEDPSVNDLPDDLRKKLYQIGWDAPKRKPERLLGILCMTMAKAQGFLSAGCKDTMLRVITDGQDAPVERTEQ